MGAPLTVHNAEIKTAAVEVRTLTISGKQVTLAVFRQLREELLIAEDGTLNGVPWGVVNYHPGKCADGVDHWHVVWQRGSDLLRSYVETRVQWPSYIPVSKVAEQWLDAAILDGWTPTFDDDPRRPRPCMLRITHGEGTIEVEVDEVAADALWPRPYFLSDDKERNEIRATAHSALRSRVVATREDLLARVAAEVDAELERRQRHEEVRKAMADLPQLFIAV